VYDSKIDGPTILLLGGIHGNEPAGSYAIKNTITKLNNKDIVLKKGKLICVPNVNYCGLRLNIRLIPFIGDLNRKFPKDLENINKINKCPITNKIVELVKQSDFILDFHEGWGYHRINKNSLGSTITPSITDQSLDIANKMLENVNDKIESNDKKFMILTKKYKELNNITYDYSESADIKGSLRNYANLLSKDYILIETTGQNNIQPLETRIKQDITFINTIFDYYKMI